MMKEFYLNGQVHNLHYRATGERRGIVDFAQDVIRI